MIPLYQRKCLFTFNSNTSIRTIISLNLYFLILYFVKLTFSTKSLRVTRSMTRTHLLSFYFESLHRKKYNEGRKIREEVTL